MGRLLPVLGAFAVSYAAGLSAIFLAGRNAPSWYASLRMPPLALPEASLLPLCIALFTLMALALALIWLSDSDSVERGGWIRLHLIVLLFWMSWSLFFFGLHSLLLAFLDALMLTFVLLILIAKGWEIDRRASYLLSPCFVLALLICFLNLNIWFIN